MPPNPELGFFAKPPAFVRAYEELLHPLREERFSLLELGVAHGDSLVMWREGFPRATVVGVDIDPPDVDLGQRVHIERGDQADAGFLASLRERFAPDGFEVIVDDASHVGTLTARSLQALFVGHLRPNGLYVIEDWETGYYTADSWPDGSAPETRVDVATLDAVSGEHGMPSHDHGMVGLLKRVVDHVAATRIAPTKPDSAVEPLPLDSVLIRPGMAVLRKAPAADPVQPAAEPGR